MSTPVLLVLAACLAAVNEYRSEATQGRTVGLKYFGPSRRDMWEQEHKQLITMQEKALRVWKGRWESRVQSGS